MVNNIISKFKPIKILGKGSQGTIISTHDDNYIIKIYTKRFKNLKMLIKIIAFFINYSYLPKTIYKPYHISEHLNSLNRYINNNLLDHFSYSNEENLKIMSIKYDISPKLFEVMKKYEISLQDFFQKLINNNMNNTIKIELLHSLFYQGLFTLVWLYIKKGIVHLDINSDNFFVEKTNDEIFSINIEDITYNIKLYGYYLVIADFGHARSIEMIDYDNYEYNISVNLESLNIHPLNDIIDYIKIFKKYFTKLDVNNIEINLDRINDRSNYTKQDYRNMIRSYYKKKDDFKKNVKIFKKEYFMFFRKYILNENITNQNL